MQLDEAAKFCAACGSFLAAAQPPAPPPQKKNRTGLLLAGVLGGVALLAAAVLIIVLPALGKKKQVTDYPITLGRRHVSFTSGFGFHRRDGLFPRETSECY